MEAPPETSTSVFLLTARASDEEVARGLKAGANSYLRKPFALDELERPPPL